MDINNHNITFLLVELYFQPSIKSFLPPDKPLSRDVNRPILLNGARVGPKESQA